MERLGRPLPLLFKKDSWAECERIEVTWEQDVSEGSPEL
jgi:hypothetical protein